MKRLKAFISLTLIGGLAVVLPVAILLMILQWLFVLVTSAIQPLTDRLTDIADIREIVADVAVVITILGACFVVGLLVKTGVGRWLHQRFDSVLTKLAPGYRMIRDVVSQFLGGEDASSLLNGKVCSAQIFGRENPVSVTGIVTDEHNDGSYTIFVPTAPIPTSGMVYHLPPSCVKLLPHISVETAMRTVIACGAGSRELTE